MDARPEMGEDFQTFYDKIAATEHVPDDTLFWSEKREEVRAAFELRERRQRATDHCPPVYTTARNYAIHIILCWFPPEVSQQPRSLNYFADVCITFRKFELVFEPRQAALMSVFFPNQPIPPDWRRIWFTKEQAAHDTFRVTRWGAYNEVVVNFIHLPYLMEMNIEHPAALDVEWKAFASAGVEIVEKRFDALLKPKGSVVFDVKYNATHIARAEQFNPHTYVGIRELNLLARAAHSSGKYWSIVCMHETDYVAARIIVAGLYADRELAIAVWRRLLTENVGTIESELWAAYDNMWVGQHDRTLVETNQFYSWTRWCSVVWNEIRGVVIALLPLNLPPYIILELLDYTNHLYACQPEYKKVNLIVALIASARKVVAQRHANIDAAKRINE